MRAEEALAIGIVDRVVPKDEVLHVARHWAAELGHGAVVAMGLAKRAIDDGLGRPLAEGLDLEARSFVEVFDTEDAATGVASFREHGPGDGAESRGQAATRVTGLRGNADGCHAGVSCQARVSAIFSAGMYDYDARLRLRPAHRCPALARSCQFQGDGYQSVFVNDDASLSNVRRPVTDAVGFQRLGVRLVLLPASSLRSRRKRT